MSRDRAYFILRRLHSLTGVIPAGLFLLMHGLINTGALLGECSFTEGVQLVNRTPYLPYVEIFGILLPLVFHGVIGLWMVFVQSSFNSLSYNYSRNWWYLVQRVTAVIVFVFLGWHLWDTWLAKQLGDIQLEGFYQHLVEGMSSDRVTLVMYTVGTLAASFHLMNGLWGFFASWGLTQSRKSQRAAGWLFGLGGAAFFALWLNIIFHFARGGTIGPDNLIPVQEPPVVCGAEELAQDGR
jgi:succinate dehydrogenase / fumarate reductase, cytochrome b subunit